MIAILNTIQTIKITLINYKDISLILQIFTKFKTICSAKYQMIFYEELKEIKINLEKQIVIFLSDPNISSSIKIKLKRTQTKLQKLNLKFD
jgi:hypothetical protein